MQAAVERNVGLLLMCLDLKQVTFGSWNYWTAIDGSLLLSPLLVVGFHSKKLLFFVCQ